MELNAKQQAAVDMAADWYKKQNKPIFKLAGYAGTGKTTVATTIAHALEPHEDRILFCAYTGKAACVMRQKGMPGQTIHSAIYTYEVKVDSLSGRKHFIKHLRDSLPYSLIIVDEASMVGSEVADDLLSFHIPVLAIGDTGQLPPVGDSFSNLLKDPDVILDEIMRQADGNSIPLFAQKLRRGWAPRAKDFKSDNYVQVLNYGQFVKHFARLLTCSSQMICATNRNREILNMQARRANRFEGILREGEKIIRKENDWKRQTVSEDIGVLNLVNGMTGYARNVRIMSNSRPVFDFEPAFARDTFFRHLHWDKFDYAYVITAHAAQGSEYPFVVVIDDSWDDRQNPNFRSEWRYTAATRAKGALIWVTNR
jgi:exodeoxyribonuclease-5